MTPSPFKDLIVVGPLVGLLVGLLLTVACPMFAMHIFFASCLLQSLSIQPMLTTYSRTSFWSPLAEAFGTPVK